MEKVKYYTPEIEEFHEGFICEMESSWGWQKGTFPTILKSDTLSGFLIDKVGYWEALLKLIIGVRVKFLDKDDIESEGWKFTSTNKMRWWFEGSDSWFNNDIPDSPSGRYWGFQLIFDPELHTVQISTKTNNGDQTYEPFFQGYCKNINELRKIMKQLNIK